MSPSGPRQTVLQLVHGYNAPFLELANRYAELFGADNSTVVTVYLCGAPDASVEAATRAAQVHFLDLSNRDLKGLKLRAVRQLRQLLRRYRPRAVVAHRYKSIYTALLASLGGAVPVIGVAHAFGVFASPGRYCLARAFRSRLRLLGVSNAVRDDLRQSLPFMPCECIQTQYNCIDVEALRSTHLAREEARRALKLPPRAFVFANVGRLHPDKDQSTLLQAFALALGEMPEARLMLVGTGREEKRYRALCDELGIAGHVHFAGFLERAERYFRAFDCYVSSSDREPFGMVLVEAMAAELPLISTDCGGGGELAEGVGQLFGKGDTSRLAEAMRSVYHAGEEARSQMGRRGLDKARANYDCTVFRRTFQSRRWV